VWISLKTQFLDRKMWFTVAALLFMGTAAGPAMHAQTGDLGDGRFRNPILLAEFTPR
jgi:hypothetical protein